MKKLILVLFCFAVTTACKKDTEPRDLNGTTWLLIDEDTYYFLDFIQFPEPDPEHHRYENTLNFHVLLYKDNQTSYQVNYRYEYEYSYPEGIIMTDAGAYHKFSVTGATLSFTGEAPIPAGNYRRSSQEYFNELLKKRYSYSTLDLLYNE